MENFEEKILKENITMQVRWWKRYVDDGIALVRQGEEVALLEKLNRGHDAIKFTCEVEQQGSLPFLDVFIQKVGKKVTTKVFRKKTHTDRYLDFSSSHPGSTKWGLVDCLVKRANRICSEEGDLMEERKKLEGIFVRNGFPRRTLRKRIYGERRPRETTVDRHKLVIPYVPGLGERIRRAVSSLGIGVWFKRGRTFRNILSNSKLEDRDQLETGGVVYKQKCGSCDKFYVGETGRKAKKRKMEHEKDVKEMNVRSAIAEHCHTKGHRPDFDSFCIVDREKDWRRRRIKEAIYIRTTDNFNRDAGLDIGRTWDCLIRRMVPRE